ncbi:MAG: hypothetical protein GKC00_05015 [Candidatus Methanofastidiosa archaeon]|nr:hypothetical protein [Candidatus Methanofastidiosa archaeon]
MKLNDFEKMVYDGLMQCDNLEDCKTIVKESISMLNEFKDDENAKPYYLMTLSNLSTMLQMMSHSLSVKQFKEELNKVVEL